MTPIQALGWLGNACFFLRFLFQWFLSERAGKSLTPPIFWRLSLMGSVSLGTYSYSQSKFVMLVGYGMNGLIYARNIHLQRRGRQPGIGPRSTGVIATLAISALIGAGFLSMFRDPEAELVWVICAGAGQAIWSSRFVVQWWASERAGRSHFPAVFWKISLVGNALLLAYAFSLGDPIYIAGFLPGPIVQIRNLVLRRRGGDDE